MNNRIQLLTENEGIIFGVLKKCSIKPFHPYYEDFIQIGRITLLEAIDNYPVQPIKEEELYPFKGYAYKKVYWKILDEVKKYQRQAGKTEEFSPDLQSRYHTTENTSFEEEIYVLDLFESLLPTLSKNQRLFFIETYFHDLTITEISKKYKVSRKSIYQWRNTLALKCANYFQK